MLDQKRGLARAIQYANQFRLTIKGYLGGGTDGQVYKSDDDTAIKVFEHEFSYCNERDTYSRLAEYGVIKKIDEFWIPEMVGHDDSLLVVEMDIMHNPPYILDFAKVKLDQPPDFPKDVIDEWEKKGAGPI